MTMMMLLLMMLSAPFVVFSLLFHNSGWNCRLSHDEDEEAIPAANSSPFGFAVIVVIIIMRSDEISDSSLIDESMRRRRPGQGDDGGGDADAGRFGQSAAVRGGGGAAAAAAAAVASSWVETVGAGLDARREEVDVARDGKVRRRRTTPSASATTAASARKLGGPLGELWMRLSASSLRTFVMRTFLPTDFPAEIREEYIEYQTWDSVQALCSYLRGVLATASVLSAVGVGSEGASPLAAAFTWVVKDGVGICGSLLFAFFVSASLDCNVKEWRLFADVINDVALVLDMLSSLPWLRPFFLYVAIVSAICKAMCGVAAGATKSAVSAHFAVHGNLADMASKEGTQETAVTLVGLMFGMLLSRAVHGVLGLQWLLFLALTGVHVWANARAVKALRLRTLNRSRFALLLETWFSPSAMSGGRNNLPSPAQLVHRDTLLGSLLMAVHGPRVGVHVQEIVQAGVPTDSLPSLADALEADRFAIVAARRQASPWTQIAQLFPHHPRLQRGVHVLIALAPDATPADEIRAVAIGLRIMTSAEYAKMFLGQSSARGGAGRNRTGGGGGGAMVIPGASALLPTPECDRLVQALSSCGWETERPRFDAAPVRIQMCDGVSSGVIRGTINSSNSNNNSSSSHDEAEGGGRGSRSQSRNSSRGGSGAYDDEEGEVDGFHRRVSPRLRDRGRSEEEDTASGLLHG